MSISHLYNLLDEYSLYDSFETRLENLIEQQEELKKPSDPAVETILEDPYLLRIIYPLSAVLDVKDFQYLELAFGGLSRFHHLRLVAVEKVLQDFRKQDTISKQELTQFCSDLTEDKKTLLEMGMDLNAFTDLFERNEGIEGLRLFPLKESLHVFFSRFLAPEAAPYLHFEVFEVLKNLLVSEGVHSCVIQALKKVKEETHTRHTLRLKRMLTQTRETLIERKKRHLEVLEQSKRGIFPQKGDCSWMIDSEHSEILSLTYQIVTNENFAKNSLKPEEVFMIYTDPLPESMNGKKSTVESLQQSFEEKFSQSLDLQGRLSLAKFWLPHMNNWNTFFESYLNRYPHDLEILSLVDIPIVIH